MVIDDRMISIIESASPQSIGLYLYKDGKMNTLYRSSGLAGYLGMSDREFDEASQHDAFDLVTDHDRERAAAQTDRAVREYRSATIAFRVLDKNNHFVCVRARVQAVGEMNGDPVVLAVYGGISSETKSFENLVDNIAISIYVIDKQSHELLYVNAHALKASGDREYCGASCYKFFNDLDEPCPWCSLSSIRNGSAHVAENYVPPLDKWFRHDVFDIDWYGIEAAAFYITDITNEKREEQIKVKGLYNRILHANPDALAMFQLNLTQNTCGEGQSPYPSVLEQQKSGTADGYFEACADIVADKYIRQDCRKRFTRRNLIREFRQGKSEETIEYPTVSSNGIKMWIKGTISMIENPVNSDIEAVAYAVNITQRKKLELIMDRITSEDYDFASIIDVSSRTIEFISVKEEEKPFVPTKTTNYDEDIEYAVNIMSHEDAPKHIENLQLDKMLEELNKSGSYVYPFSLTDEHGEVHRKQMKCIWMDESRNFILQTRTDITRAYEEEQKQMNRLTAAMMESEKANNAKSEFVSRISHDIRTPISAIISMTQFAREDIDDREKLLEDIRKIEASNTFLLSLINDILDISKIDSGKIELFPEPYPFSDFIYKVRSMFEPLCAQKGLTFNIITERDGEACAVVDKVRFNQITMNLISNAVKYTPAGGSVTYKSESRILPGGKIRCRFTVSDTGIGMSEEFQKKMFEEFSQEKTENSLYGAGSGTGLGLAIVKRIIDLMNGDIEVHSRQGEGTSVTVTLILPGVKEAVTDTPDNEAAHKKNETRLIRPARILIVDDNAVNREIAVRLLESMGADTECAVDGAEAVEKIVRSPEFEYDAVLMDIMMPVMNGYEATEKIRSSNRSDAETITIIAMTADAFADAIKQSRDAGMNDYLTKPIDVGALAATLNKWLGSAGRQ